MELSEYQNRFRCVEVTRSDDGVLVVRMQNRGSSLVWNGLAHRELPELFSMIASDRENRVMILTGTGDEFIGLGEGGPNPLAQGRIRPASWEQIIFEGNRLVLQLLEIDVPVICALNGPVTAHSELAVLCDIVIAADHVDGTLEQMLVSPMPLGVIVLAKIAIMALLTVCTLSLVAALRRRRRE